MGEMINKNAVKYYKIFKKLKKKYVPDNTK
jgi:hypothetical protein